MILYKFETLISPLEQFKVVPIIVLHLGNVDFSITNVSVSWFVILFILYIFRLIIVSRSNFTFFIVPHRWQVIVEMAYIGMLITTLNNINHSKGKFFFPLIFSLFIYTFFLNIFGLVPYSFTLTSHLIGNFALSLSVFVGLNIHGFRTRRLAMFKLVLPLQTPISLSLILIPLEFISYVIKPVNLTIRMFANIMGGHTLIAIVVGFFWKIMCFTGVFFLFKYSPILILFPLFLLEVAISLIQSFVFCSLVCIYIGDMLRLH
jgi:ATP synthase subunit 6